MSMEWACVCDRCGNVDIYVCNFKEVSSVLCGECQGSVRVLPYVDGNLSELAKEAPPYVCME